MNTVRLIQLLMGLVAVGVGAPPKEKPDPRVSSIYPMTGQRGKTLDAVLRGSNLADARALIFEGDGLEASILFLHPEPAAAAVPAGGDAPKDRPRDLLSVRLTIQAEAAIG